MRVVSELVPRFSRTSAASTPRCRRRRARLRRRQANANTKLDPLFGGHTGIALGHATLHVHGAAHRIDHAGELQQQAIAGGLDDPATVLGDLGVNKLPPVVLQSRQGGAVVAAHEQGIAHHIGRYDCRKSSVVPCQASLPEGLASLHDREVMPINSAGNRYCTSALRETLELPLLAGYGRSAPHSASAERTRPAWWSA
jgi:hypothetical protein